MLTSGPLPLYDPQGNPTPDTTLATNCHTFREPAAQSSARTTGRSSNPKHEASDTTTRDASPSRRCASPVTHIRGQ